MRYFLSCAFLCFNAIGLIAFPSPAATSPVLTGSYYSKEIFFRNASSYTVSLDFDIAENQFSQNRTSRFTLEKNDAIVFKYGFFVPFEDKNNFDTNLVYPENYFKNIRIFNAETGELLAEINPSNEVAFVLLNEGKDNSILTLPINDSLFRGEK